MISATFRRVADALPDGPFLRSDILRTGIPRAVLSELVSAGTFRAPLRGILVRSDMEDTLQLRAAAARLILPADAALCRGTAAWVMGFDARPPGDHQSEPRLECAVPRRRTPLRHPDITCYATDLVESDVVDLEGLPCTTPDRTAIDLARWLMPGMGLGMLDAMARAGVVRSEELLLQVERWRGDRFVARARRLIELCDPAAESFGESWLRLRFADAGFPPPELQIPLEGPAGKEIYRLDLGYRNVRCAWEYDGEEFHDGADAEASDRRRRADIEQRWDWTVLGVRKNLVLGPSMALERGVGEVLGVEPRLRRRLW